MLRLFRNIGLILAAGLALAACSKVPSGHVGVKVYLLGGAKGVDQEVLGTGRYWIGWNEELHLFPTFTQTEIWTADNRPESPGNEEFVFQDRDGMKITADVGITYELDAEKVPLLFQKFRMGVKEITNSYVRNVIRDAFVRRASVKPIDYIYGVGKAEFMSNVETDVRVSLADLGINVKNLYLLSELRLPPQIMDAINVKLQANQKALQRENEVAQVKAEAEKAREEARGKADAYKIEVEGRAAANARQIELEAEAQAKANKLLAASVTPELSKYLEVQRWNGQLPQIVAGGDKGANLLLSLPPLQK